MATATAFQCASCGGTLELTDMNNVAICPYCKKNYMTDDNYENEIKTALKNAESVIVKDIRDISVPEVKEKVKLRDVEKFKKLNESIALIEIRRGQLDETYKENLSVIEKYETGIGVNYDDVQLGSTVEDISEIQETLSSWQLMKANNALKIYNEILVKIESFPGKIYALGIHDGLINEIRSQSLLDSINELYDSYFSSFSEQVHEKNKSTGVWSWVMNIIPTSQKEKAKEITKGLQEILDIIHQENINIYEIYNAGFKIGQQAALSVNPTTPSVYTDPTQQYYPEYTPDSWTPSGTDTNTGSNSGSGSGKTTVNPSDPPVAPAPKWSGWSSWSEQYVSASATHEVKTMVRYRYHTFTCPGCGYHSSWYGINCWNCGTHIPNNWQEKWLSKDELAAVV
jgi:predicted RNA-binding Zn-ribbon protein involved in translation (DUF1610 family)